MNEILENQSPVSLVTAIRSSMYEYLMRRARVRDKAIRIEEDWVWTFENPTPMCLIDTYFEKSHAKQQIEGILSRLKRGNEKNAILDVVEPFDMCGLWAEQGLIEIEMEYGMAISLDDLKVEMPLIDGLELHIIEDQENMKLCYEVIALGRSRDHVAVFEAVHGDLSKEQENLRYYLATVHTRPVAMSLLFLSSGVATIWWVTTIPDFRKRGLGTVMTLVPLSDARKMGYRVGILASLPNVRNLYSNMGFREYCRIKAYEWNRQT